MYRADRRVATAFAVAIAVAAANGAAHAGSSWTLEGVGTCTAGVTDNALPPAAGDEDGETTRQTDAFAQLSPGLVLAKSTPRTINVITYSLELTAYADSDANALSNRVRWIGFFHTSPLTHISTRGAASHGRLNVFSASVAPDAASADSLPAGARDFASAETSATFRWRVSRPWAVHQTASGRALATFSGTDVATRVLEASGEIGAERLWRRSSVSFALRGGAAELGLRGGDGDLDLRRHLLADAVLSWRRDATTRSTVGLAAGIAAVAGQQSTARPIGRASLLYLGASQSRVELSAQRELAADLFLAETVDSLGAQVRGAMPLPFARDDDGASRFAISGAVAVRNSRALAVDDRPESDPWTTYAADAALSWSASASLSLSLRYQLVHQVGDPMLDGAFQPFTRNAVLVTVLGRYPAPTGPSFRSLATGRVEDTDRLLDVDRAGR